MPPGSLILAQCVTYLPYYFPSFWRRHGTPLFKGCSSLLNYLVIVICRGYFYRGDLLPINRRNNGFYSSIFTASPYASCTKRLINIVYI